MRKKTSSAKKIFYYIKKVIFAPFKFLAIGLIYFYKYCISPLLPSACIYQPTCSTYTLTAIKRFGVIKGSYLGLKRILRCSPNHKGGLDRVPENIKGDFKWLI